jgi:hypothetical protein
MIIDLGSSFSAEKTQVSGNMMLVDIAWKGAASGGAVTSRTIPKNEISGWFLQSIVTYPGATAPTNGYSITLKDSLGLDALLAVGASRSNTNKEIAYPLIGSLPVLVPIYDDMIFALTGNSVNSAIGTARFIFIRQAQIN